MVERCYYIDDYSDEMVPCDGTLEGWAKWLSAPSEDWGRHEAAKDGDTFRASVLRFDEDVTATLTDVGWSFSHEPQGADLIAVRFGPGTGWNCDSIVDDFDGLKDFLAGPDNQSEVGDVEHVAIGFDEPAVRLIYRADPPRLYVEAIQ